MKTKTEVRELISLYEASLDPLTLDMFTVNRKFIVDKNVYARNQQFRLLNNSKKFPSDRLHPFVPLEKMQCMHAVCIAVDCNEQK